MGLDGNWLISRMKIKGSAMLLDRSVLSIAGASLTYMKPDNTVATLGVAVNGDTFSNNSTPYVSGRIVKTPDCEFLTGWISDSNSAITRTQMDAFFAVRSQPFEGDWNIFRVSSTTNPVVSDNSALTVLGNSVTFLHADGNSKTIDKVDIGADSSVRERAENETGYRLDARLVRRGSFTFLVGTIGEGTGPLAGDTNTDTFTAVKMSPGGMLPGDSGGY